MRRYGYEALVPANIQLEARDMYLVSYGWRHGGFSDTFSTAVVDRELHQWSHPSPTDGPSVGGSMISHRWRFCWQFWDQPQMLLQLLHNLFVVAAVFVKYVSN